MKEFLQCLAFVSQKLTGLNVAAIRKVGKRHRKHRNNVMWKLY